MDREQEEMQFLGVIDIYIESYKIICRWRRIFSQITLSLILPLSFIFLAHMELSDLLLTSIHRTEIQLHRTTAGTPRYNKLSDLASSEWATYLLFQLVYFTFLAVFSLLSTSAVVYTVACAYTARDVAFKRVMSVVPRVWKRLMATFLCTYFAFFAYNAVTFVIIVVTAITVGLDSRTGPVFFVAIIILYVAGFVYMTIIWQLACVVTVLEDSCGFRAMMKGRELIKGKMITAVVLFFKLNLSAAAVNVVFKVFVVEGWRFEVTLVYRILLGLLCLLVLFKLILFGLVIQTVVYFVCKSYHHENIDKSALSDHLEVFLGEYVPLTAKDIQMEDYQA